MQKKRLRQSLELCCGENGSDVAGSDTNHLATTCAAPEVTNPQRGNDSKATLKKNKTKQGEVTVGRNIINR